MQTETQEQMAKQRRYDELYERFVKPLEATHRGEFLAVSADGRTLLGTSLRSVAKQASKEFGKGNVLFRVGEPGVGRWR
jgi:hypothetical protein